MKKKDNLEPVVELTEEEKKELKQKKMRKIKLITGIVVASILGLIFLSPYLRWQNDVKVRPYKIIYYKQDDIRIDSLVDFYGMDVDTNIDDDEAIVMYCSKNYGRDCITADYNNFVENVFRNPDILVFTSIVLVIFFVHKLIKNIYIKDYIKWIVSISIIVFGLAISFVQVYKIAEYYIFTNNKLVTNATIYKKVITGSKDSFYPIVKYEIDDKEYIEMLDTSIKGSIDEKKGEEIEIHYYKKEKETIVNKKFVLWRIAPFILGIVIIVEGTWYIPKYRIVSDDKKEEKKKDKRKK